MSDLISRQAVIELVKNSYYNLTENMDDVWAMVKDVEQIPSAEPPYQYSEAYVKQLRGERDILEEMVKNMADKPIVECRTCGRNADNGGVHEDGRTKCPIQEHYALLLDGYCHLYEPYDCGAKMYKGGESDG